VQGCSPCDFDCMGLPELLLAPRGFFVLLFALGCGGPCRRRMGGSEGGGAIYASAVVLPAKENNPRSPTHPKIFWTSQPSGSAICH